MNALQGLAGPVYHDHAYTHDYADPATWPAAGALGASAWVLEPPPGFAFRLTESEAKTSTAITIHSPLEIWFQAKRKMSGEYGPIPPVAGSGAAYCVSYANIKDWVRRGGGLPQRVTYPESAELTKPLMLFSFRFNPAPILWSSIGTDPSGLPKWNRMIIRIADGQPYRDIDGGEVELAIAKYMIEIYKEVAA